MLRVTDILARIGEHSAIWGQTGTGKTWLARRLLLPRRYVQIYDSKGFIDWPEYRLYTNLQDVIYAREEKVIYRPTYDELQNPETVNLYFSFIYARENTFCYVDEVPSISDASKSPNAFLGCFQRGRERKISMLAGSQRPVDIPKVIFTESKHYYIFRLTDDGDRKRISSNIPIKSEVLANLRERQFIYFNFDDGLRGPFEIEDQ